jgi:hypothetical protein
VPHGTAATGETKQMTSKTTTTSVSVTMTTIDFIQSDLDYHTRTDASVNPKASELIVPYSDGGSGSSMTFVNYYKVDFGGGLAGKDFKPPDFQPTTDGTPMYFGMDWLLVFRQDMWPKIPRLELDDKVMLADATKVTPTPQEQINESHQYNADTNQWQYDPDGKGWVDIGFTPPPMLLSSAGTVVSNDIRFRWWWNGKHLSDGLWSSLQMMQNNEVFNLPAKFQHLPLIAEKWGGPLRHPQIQTEGKLAAGLASDWHAFDLVRGRLIHGTQPIPLGLGWDPVTTERVSRK